MRVFFILFYLLTLHSLPSFAASECAGARHDNNVFWEGLQHDSFDLRFRAPFGAVSTQQKQLTLSFQTCADDVDQVRVRVWDDLTKQETWITLLPFEKRTQAQGDLQLWRATVPISSAPTLLYYFFEIRDGSKIIYYTDDDPAFHGGGLGQIRENYSDFASYQITVYDAAFSVPDWLKGAFIYQILPDRFRNGNPANDPKPSDWFYGRAPRLLKWSDPLCDPRSQTCFDEYGTQFYGGDLQGIIEKLEELKDLGVEALYLNPIFQAASNHRYDTQNFMQIDSHLGTLQTFQELAQKASRLGIRLILDGVFNHVSADSPYFDLFSRWDEKGELTSPKGPGGNDGSGACESANTPFRSWFFIPHVSSAALDDSHQQLVYCQGAMGSPPSTYEAWGGYYSLPKLRTEGTPVRDLFFRQGTQSVGPYWIAQGASGWRLDVAGDIDPGQSRAPRNGFWQGFRKAIRAQNPDAIMIGEEWGNASPWLLGNQWDTTMNYRFRSALLSWMFDGCQGLGCSGRAFEDNDSNLSSSSGAIAKLDEQELDNRLKSIQENYPPASWQAAMNLLDSHDTNRILFLLKKISNDQADVALAKYRLLLLFQFTYPGAPTVYAGDEVGVVGDGQWDGRSWQDDPYNRQAYPWPDRGRTPPEPSLRKWTQQLAHTRQNLKALKLGSFETRLTDTKSQVYAFERKWKEQRVLVVLNRGSSGREITLRLDGTNWARDHLSSQTLQVSDQTLHVSLKGYSGAILELKP